MFWWVIRTNSERCCEQPKQLFSVWAVRDFVFSCDIRTSDFSHYQKMELKMIFCDKFKLESTFISEIHVDVSTIAMSVNFKYFHDSYKTCHATYLHKSYKYKRRRMTLLWIVYCDDLEYFVSSNLYEEYVWARLHRVNVWTSSEVKVWVANDLWYKQQTAEPCCDHVEGSGLVSQFTGSVATRYLNTLMWRYLTSKQCLEHLAAALI